MQWNENSTHDVVSTFDRICLTNTWARRAPERVQLPLGRVVSGKHTKPKRDTEIFSLAMSLYTGGYSCPRTDLTVSMKEKIYLSPDIQEIALNTIQGKVSGFNARAHEWIGDNPIEGESYNDELEMTEEDATWEGEIQLYLLQARDGDFDCDNTN